MEGLSAILGTLYFWFILLLLTVGLLFVLLVCSFIWGWGTVLSLWPFYLVGGGSGGLGFWLGRKTNE